MGKHLPASLLLVLAMILAPCGESRAATKRALLIGINDYLANDPGQQPQDSGGWIPEDLQGAVNDISLMEQVLTTRFGFQPGDIQRLENAQATREAMLSALQAFVAGSAADDIVYIHFSGHGSQVEDRDGDEADGKDETILPHDARTGQVPDITDDELNRIFAGLQTPNSLIVLDSCHSGTATRGASALKTRAVPQDPRGQLYGGGAAATGAAPDTANYLLLTGAAAYQSALDGPLDEGRYYGLFTLSLGRSLARIPAGASARDLHAEARREMERIGGEFGLFAVPEAQLEGNPQRMAQGVLGESQGLARRSAARLAWAEVTSEPGSRVRLRGARSLATRAGSVWAVYPAGEERFPPGQALGLVTVESLAGDDAIATVDDGLPLPSEGRAVQLLDAPPNERVTLRLDRMSATRKAELAAALSRSGAGRALEIVDGPGFARFIVDEDAGRFTVFAAGGLQRWADIPARDLDTAARELAELASRSMTVSELLSIDNAASGIRLSAAVNPLDASGSVRGIAVVGASDAPAYRIRRPDETRDHSNSLVLEIEVSQDAYLTIVNVDPEGNVAMLFPNTISEQNRFYPDGLITAAEPVRIPDGLKFNRAGFNWDFTPPAGLDTLRIFAATDLATARRIRAQIEGMGTRLTQRGAGGDPRKNLFQADTRLNSRGIAVTANEAAPAHDWTATTVNLVIEE